MVEEEEAGSDHQPSPVRPSGPNTLLTFSRPNQEGKTKNADLTLKLHLGLHNSKTLTGHFLFSVVCVGGE